MTTTANLSTITLASLRRRMLRYVLRVVEDRPALVQKQVDTELDTAFHHPSEGAIVVVRRIVHEEGVVEAVCVYRQAGRYAMHVLEGAPYLR